MTAKNGYVWSGTEWVLVGNPINPFKYQATAPSNPTTGDIWIDSDEDVASINDLQYVRWRKTLSGGETSLSGIDDLGLPLTYNVGYEQVVLNGVILVRSLDYTATTGTTITGLTALAANDVIEVFSVVTRAIGDVYTQSQVNSLVSQYASTGKAIAMAIVFGG